MQKTGSASLAIGVMTLFGVHINTVNAFEYEFHEHQLEVGGRSRLAYIDGEDQDAHAASFLLRLRATSQWADELNTLLELDAVALGWEDEFSNGVHFNDKPVVPDVSGFDLNQLLATYRPNNHVTVFIGREAVELGNQRFVGSNSFWQNEQTLDMVGFKYSYGSASYISYRYVDNANRISGDDAGKFLSPSDSNFTQNNGLRPVKFLGDHNHDSHLIFAEFKEWDYSQLQAYYFDMTIKEGPALANKTLGARYEYKGRIGNKRIEAHGELALQERPEVNQNHLIPYYNVGAGVGYGRHELSFNYEELGENNNFSFVTPLGSLHDQNGWADKFLLTPNSGLKDASLRYMWRDSPWKVDARYHRFYKAQGEDSLGNEFDIDVFLKFSRKGMLLLRFAEFSSDDASLINDQRIFLQYTYNL